MHKCKEHDEELIALFHLDVTSDDPDVHPKLFCSSWRNLNLAIGNRAYKFLLRHRVSYGGSPHVVRKCEDRSRNHGRVSTRELCSRPSHIQEYVDSVVGGSTFCGFGLTFDATLDFSICFLKILLG